MYDVINHHENYCAKRSIEMQKGERLIDFDQKGSENSPATSSNSPGSSHSGNLSDSAETRSKEKICVVCGDAATGTHFAAMTCEGCKGFFRRSMKKCSQFTCAFENKCTINKSNRKHCQACRLQKCLAVGMNSNLIMSDESVNRKRELIRANREKRLQIRMKKEQEEMEKQEKSRSSTHSPAVDLMPEDKSLIKMLLDSHNSSYDFSYQDYETFRGRQHIASPNSDEVKTTHLTLAWLMAANSEANGTAKEKSMKGKKPSSKDKEGDLSGIKSEAVFEGFTSDNPPKEVLDMFSTLHGVSQDTSACVSGGSASYHSETSGSMSSSPPYGALGGAPFGIDPLSPEYAQQAPDLSSMFEDSMPAFGFDSLTNLQSLFMSQEHPDGKTHSLFQHFCDIMTWGIKKVIEFCKLIPEFQELSTADQINLLRGGCLEMLVLRSYFAFASDGNKYMSDKFEYSPTDFLQAGGGAEFVEQYTKVHMRMRKMKLKVEEICLLIGLVLFSPDRPGIQAYDKVEAMQKRIAQALRAYEYSHKDPEKACVVYSELLLLLPVLRTINVYFSNTILTLRSTNEDDMNPLILEVNN